MWLTIQKFFRFVGRLVFSFMLLLVLLITAVIILAVQLIANAPM